MKELNKRYSRWTIPELFALSVSRPLNSLFSVLFKSSNPRSIYSNIWQTRIRHAVTYLKHSSTFQFFSSQLLKFVSAIKFWNATMPQTGPQLLQLKIILCYGHYRKSIGRLAIYPYILFYPTKKTMYWSYRKSSHLCDISWYTIVLNEIPVYLTIHYSPGLTRPLFIYKAKTIINGVTNKVAIWLILLFQYQQGSFSVICSLCGKVN